MKRGATVDLGDLKWEPMKGVVNFKGTARFPDGRVPQGTYARSLRNFDSPIRSTFIIKDGAFEGELPPGRYGVFAIGTDVEAETEKNALAVFTIRPGTVAHIELTLNHPIPTTKSNPLRKI